MSVERDTQEILELCFDPYKVLYFDIDSFRAEYFLAEPSSSKDFDAIFLGLAYPEDDPKNFIDLAQFVQKAGNRPVFVMPAYEDPEIERLSIEHGASGVILRGSDQLEDAIDQAKLLMAQRH